MNFYLHIPFCEKKCNYCAFTSLKKRDERAYFEALKKDICFHLAKFGIQKIETLFIGGGTPSCVEAGLYEEIFKILSPYFKKNTEISCEANPNSASFEWLLQMKNLGVNRISFGIQSFDEKKLKFLGRIHNKKIALKALENAYKAGFDNINLDLIYDTKFDNKKMLEFELLNLEKIKPLITHLSAYSLSIEPKTAFKKNENFKKNSATLAKFFIKNLKDLGFFQYEISNFYKEKSKICKHNLAYWQGKNYLACGLSGVGFYKNKRFYTKNNLKAYLQDPCFREVENLSFENLNLEHLFLGLRSIVGINDKRLNDEQRQKISLLVKEKKLKQKHGWYFNENFLLSDELVLFISS